MAFSVLLCTNMLKLIHCMPCPEAMLQGSNALQQKVKCTLKTDNQLIISNVQATANKNMNIG